MLRDGVNHVAVISRDVERLGAFYTTAFDAGWGSGHIDHLGLQAASAGDGAVNDFGAARSIFFTDPDGLEGEVPVPKEAATFVYVRLHGPDRDHLYAGSYSDDELTWWADHVGEWHRQCRNMLLYFNNNGEGHAVRNSRDLRAKLRTRTPVR